MDNDTLLIKLRAEKTAGIKCQQRRHEAWEEIYALYRDKIETNELTQRQEVNIPIMKETKKTLLSRIDDAPDVVFDCLEKGPAGREKEIVINEKWQDDFEKCNYEAVDILEKNNVLLFGRTYKMLNWVAGRISVSVPHRLDLVIDPHTSPLDIETAKYIVRLHIWRSLRQILADPKYTQEGKDALKMALQDGGEGGEGIIKFGKDDAQESKEKTLSDLGIDNFDDLFAYDAQVELNEHFTLIWEPKQKKFVRYVVVTANESTILYKETLKNTLNIEFWPFTTWADDIDTDDIWPDGIGDVVRIPNKVANVYFSSLLENWVYRGMGMSWYLPVAGYDPATFEPEPFGQYPAPLVKDGRGGFLPVEQVVKQMNIPALEMNLVGIDFLVRLIEKATAATAIEKGVGEKKAITLGEVEQLVARASERIISIAKFYRRAWKEYAWKWRKMNEANASSKSPFKLYKKGVKGGYFEKMIYPKDWISQKGYREKVSSSAEQETERQEEFAELAFLQKQFPNNPAVQKIVRKRMVGKLDLTPDEMREIEDAENEMEKAGIPGAGPELAPEGARPSAPAMPIPVK